MMTRVCICCKYQASEDVPQSDVSFFKFPKSNELLKKWSLAIGTEKKIARWSLICSRHFKEDDFRHSLFGNNRYLKQEAIPSLYLNGENNDDMVLDNRGTIVKENQPTNTVAEYSERDPENKTLNITGSHVRVERDDNLFKSRILPTPAGPSKPEKKRKKHLYDVRWEEISTSSVQAKIYWEVAIKKIMQQKMILRTLRDQSRRLEKQIQTLQTLVKNKAIKDT